METTETVVQLNKRLIDHFGLDTSTSQAIWRIVYSDDQYEHRKGTYDDYTGGGIFLRTVTEVRYTTKYSWIRHKFILEQLVAVPFQNAFDLPDNKISYEVLWVFEDKNGDALPPKWEACKFIIDAVNAARGASSLAKYARYRDPESTQEEALAAQAKKLNDIGEALYGDDSSLMGATINCGTAIIVPQTYNKRG